MSGTKVGGIKAKETNLKKHGNNFYALIGAKGGRNGHSGGFASMSKERVAEVGSIGGKKSSRLGIKTGEGKEKVYKPVWGE
jgi:hypothetical protein